MIVPMKKYTFLAYHAEYEDFLKELRQLGVVDIVEKTRHIDDDTRDRLLEQKQVYDAIRLLQKRKVEAGNTPSEYTDGRKVIAAIRELGIESESIEQQLQLLQKEISTLTPWGAFSTETLSKLKEAGYQVSFYMISEKKFNPAWTEQYPIGIVSTIPPNVYFVLIREISDEEVAFDIPAEEVRVPRNSLPEVMARRDKLNDRLTAIGQELDRLAASAIPLLQDTLNRMALQIDYRKVLTNTLSEADDKLMILQGYVPGRESPRVAGLCDEKGILYIEGQPEVKDKIPVLLQNNRFSKLFEPIGKLFSLPSYSELDLTPFFAPFFMMFFGFCLGDAGYGLLMLLGATLYKRKAKPAFRPYLSLAQYLGIATVIFGVVSGTFFGIDLIKTKVGFLEGIREYFLDSQKMFYLALILGGIQIVFGMVVKVLNTVRQFGFAYAFSTLGWLLLILGMAARLALIQKGWLPAEDTVVLYAILGISGVMILFLNDPKVNVFVRFGKGIWDVYGMVTGIFGDLLSYIRLFALGISSAILGLVINSIGLDMLGIPVIGPVLFVVFLTVGHLANILISSLGAFVHPMRLTFVEFYKNAGFTGGGKAYKPFAEKTIQS